MEPSCVVDIPARVLVAACPFVDYNNQPLATGASRTAWVAVAFRGVVVVVAAAAAVPWALLRLVDSIVAEGRHCHRIAGVVPAPSSIRHPRLPL